MKSNKSSDQNYQLLMLHLDALDAKEAAALNKSIGAETVAEQLDQLDLDLQRIDQRINSYQPPADYAENVWQNISAQLHQDSHHPEENGQEATWFRTVLTHLQQPRFSLSGVFSLVLIVSLSFFLLNQRSEQALDDELQQRLLATNIHRHLTQTEIFLTGFSNADPTIQSTVPDAAQQLLSTNRLFKAALEDKDSPHLSALLSDLELVFLELANQPINTAQFFYPNQQRVAQRNLLFKVKTMAHQLDNQPMTL